jgi:hypothetical protein
MASYSLVGEYRRCGRLTAVTFVRKEISGKYLTNRATAEFSRSTLLPGSGNYGHQTETLVPVYSDFWIVFHHNLLFMKLIFRMFSGTKIKFRISAQIGCGPD